MKPAHIIKAIEEFAPRVLQEKWDNTGMQIGFPPEADCTGVLLCIDVTEDIIAEAVSSGCNLVLSHHPLIFKGIRSLTGSTVPERAAIAAIRSGVAVYSCHTALDSTHNGISYAMARMLGAEVRSILEPSEARMAQINVICPRDISGDVRLALLDASSSLPAPFSPAASLTSSDTEEYSLGEFSEETLSFSISHTPLTRVCITVPQPSVNACLAILDGMLGEIRYTVAPLDTPISGTGLGVVAEFPENITAATLIEKIKKCFGTRCVRANQAFASAAACPETAIRRIALCGGSGGEFIPQALRAGAQVYITADVRYHDFADHREDIGILDIGHFESEACAKDIFYHLLTKKFPNFAVRYSKSENNPVHYL